MAKLKVSVSVAGAVTYALSIAATATPTVFAAQTLTIPAVQTLYLAFTIPSVEPFVVDPHTLVEDWGPIHAGGTGASYLDAPQVTALLSAGTVTAVYYKRLTPLGRIPDVSVVDLDVDQVGEPVLEQPLNVERLSEAPQVLIETVEKGAK